MSSTTSAPQKRRDSSQTSPASASVGDHRKRRRNRTTQSCLNCHTSKRMCDRRRPCGRCTQLGLTGLCVYEVDDPSQRNDPGDDKSRLQKRVAELEGVIRELKHKPHPKWTQSPGARLHEDATLHQDFSILSHALPLFQPGEQQSEITHDTGLQNSRHSSSSPATSVPLPDMSSMSQGLSFASSPSSSGSPLVTPRSTGMACPGLSNSPHQFSTSPDESVTSLLSYLMNFEGLEDGPVTKMFEGAMSNVVHGYPQGSDYFQHGHLVHRNPASPLAHPCDCLRESNIYSVVLELSIRLRNAAETLTLYPDHGSGSVCLLKQRIAELDTLASSMLGDAQAPDFTNRQQMPQTGLIPLPSDALTFRAPYYSGPITSWASVNPTAHPETISPQVLIGPSASFTDMESLGTVPASEDSLMSWEPGRHRHWPLAGDATGH